MQKSFLVALIAIALNFVTPAAFADEYAVGDLVIVDPYARPTPPEAPVTGGYLAIRNNGSEEDRLVGGTAPFAGKIEIHEMKMDGDVMQMREVEGGLVIPAGGEVTLQPGGLHIMFMQLREKMTEGDRHSVTLEFEQAGSVTVEFDIGKPN